MLNVTDLSGFGVALFSPTSLFLANEPGFWAPVRKERLWQDTARTTAVTTAGDPVASWELTTASGVIYAEQSTSGKRPTYQEDAGRGYLDFDGSDDALVVSSLDLSATDKVTQITGLQKDTTTQQIITEHTTNINSQVGAFYLVAGFADSAASAYAGLSRGTAAPNLNQNSNTAASFAAVIKNTVTALHDIAGDNTSMRVDGAASGTPATGDKGTGNFASAAFHIGARGGTSVYFNGRIYGMIVRGALTSGANLTDAETWMNTLVNG